MIRDIGDPGDLFAGTDLGCVRAERAVFARLAFRVEAGGALALTGANGSGKSSLLRLMAGLGQPAAGRLTWGGVDVADDPEAHRARLSYVGHADAVKPQLTVAEDLRFAAALYGVADAETRATAALDALGIGPLADVPGRYLSAGQRRRVALARALVGGAPLWLLDEPATALDADGVNRLASAVAAHRRDGGRVVLSTHGGYMPDSAATLDLGAFAVDPVAAP